MPNPTLIYDDACPMCKGYTTVFERAGWCGRAPFSRVGEGDTPPGLDIDRARHEIPLITPEGHVRYGLDAMTHVLATGMPILRPVLCSRVLRLLLTPLYKIITYNRRLIAGTRAPAQGFDCAPDRHPGWRWTYILLATAATLLLGLPLIPLLALLAVGLRLLWHTDDWLSVLGQLATVGFSLAVLHSLLPIPLALPVVCMVLGVEVYRRFGWGIPAVG